MTDYQQSIEYQNEQFKKKIIAPLFTSSQNISLKQSVKTYKYIFLLNLLKSRPELRKFWNDYLYWSISFLYEAYVSANLGQKNGCYFLLRSSLENFVKFVCRAVGKEEEISDHGFKNNNHILTTYDWPKNGLAFFSKVCYFQSMYNNFSKLSHSAIKINDQTPITYFSKIVENFDNEYNDAMNNIQKLSDFYVYFIIFVCKSSLEKWDTYDLTTILRITYTDKQTKMILKFIKN